MRVLAISGSLRRGSSNTALLQLAAELAPPGMLVTLFPLLGDLPHFNPDLDAGIPPDPILDLRRAVGEADAVLISSPEYAHGPPGVLKNALDWLVGSLEFPEKPVALVNASPLATHAQASLVATLTVMNADLVVDGWVTIPVTRGDIDAAGQIGSEEIRAATRRLLDTLAAHHARR